MEKLACLAKILGVDEMMLENLDKVMAKKTGKVGILEKVEQENEEVIENIFIAQHRNKEQKLIYLNKASDKLDLLKFMFQIAWEIKALDNKKYIIISEYLNEIGRMLGGWLKQTRH